MLDWIKRMAASSPREAVAAENENQVSVTETKVERLAARLVTSPHGTESIIPTRPVLVADPMPVAEPPVAKMAVSEPVVLQPIAAQPPMLLNNPAPRAKVIAVVSQKGGSGKTTIAAHLAVRANAAGDGPVALMDTDPQGSLTEWWRARDDDTLALTQLSLDDLESELAKACYSGASYVIIDTPPALTTSIEAVIAVADLVVIPARPSPHDLRAIGATMDMTNAARKQFLFVVNGAAPRANITAEAVAALSEHGRVAPIILYQRTEFAGSMIDGRTVMEASPAGRSANEIADLWKFVSTQVGALREAA